MSEGIGRKHWYVIAVPPAGPTQMSEHATEADAHHEIAALEASVSGMIFYAAPRLKAGPFRPGVFDSGWQAIHGPIFIPHWPTG